MEKQYTEVPRHMPSRSTFKMQIMAMWDVQELKCARTQGRTRRGTKIRHTRRHQLCFLVKAVCTSVPESDPADSSNSPRDPILPPRSYEQNRYVLYIECLPAIQRQHRETIEAYLGWRRFSMADHSSALWWICAGNCDMAEETSAERGVKEDVQCYHDRNQYCARSKYCECVQGHGIEHEMGHIEQ